MNNWSDKFRDFTLNEQVFARGVVVALYGGAEHVNIYQV